jgi:hypothetical protein
MTEEKNILKAIKKSGHTTEEALQLLKDAGFFTEKYKVLEEEEAAKKKKEAEAEEEEEEEEAEEETTPEPKPPKEPEKPKDSNEKILAEISELKKTLTELKTKGIPLKKPSKGEKMKELDLPDGVNVTEKHNKFEVMI